MPKIKAKRDIYPFERPHFARVRWAVVCEWTGATIPAGRPFVFVNGKICAADCPHARTIWEDFAELPPVYF